MQRRGRRLVVRIREFCRNESIGIVLPVGFLALWVAWDLARTFIGGFIYPMFLALFDRNGDNFNRSSLEFEILGIEYQPDTFLIEIIATLLTAVAVYYVFIRPIPQDGEPDRGMRECPECFSEIVVDARRCPFCTSAVEPLIWDVADAGDMGERTG